MAATCSAFVSATVREQTGHVRVVYCCHHVGHESTLGHTRLSAELKRNKFYDGVLLSTAMNSVQDRLCNVPATHDHLLSRWESKWQCIQYNVGIDDRCIRKESLIRNQSV
jgi:hypothetical protein